MGVMLPSQPVVKAALAPAQKKGRATPAIAADQRAIDTVAILRKKLVRADEELSLQVATEPLSPEINRTVELIAAKAAELHFHEPPALKLLKAMIKEVGVPTTAVYPESILKAAIKAIISRGVRLIEMELGVSPLTEAEIAGTA